MLRSKQLANENVRANGWIHFFPILYINGPDMYFMWLPEDGPEGSSNLSVFATWWWSAPKCTFALVLPPSLPHSGVSSFLFHWDCISSVAKSVWRFMTPIKWWKKITYSPDYCTQQGSHSNMKEKSKAYRQAKAERIQHHQTSSPTNTKGYSLDRKHKKGV